MATKKTHLKCLRRARIRRLNGISSHRIEKQNNLEQAWKNIFIKAGILEAK
ncbi:MULTISPECIES: DUF3983 domain-containing protein [Bacillaceae]|uniref:DUF3983 domain-containing protein n=1 Tax=Bacillaceae TaxID=186817 RepID=UPI002352BF9A|nr:DUF3983 domain-containing protein [Bacillus weihaiensis]